MTSNKVIKCTFKKLFFKITNFTIVTDKNKNKIIKNNFNNNTYFYKKYLITVTGLMTSS